MIAWLAQAVIGETIKDFKLTALLGRGGMGEVYSATQQLVQTKVAIKVLREEISKDQQHVQRFFNEAIAASKIKHAGIVKIFDAGFHEGRAYLIMELLEGESLAARIARAPRLSTEELVDIGAQMSSLLEATHAAGIIHRDLKPDNVFLVPDAELASGKRVKILDFGIAKLAQRGAEPVGATVLTMSNSSMGTPAYMAPEQWNDAAHADARADVYSMGCVVFELCCSRPPFVVTSMGDACNKHLNELPPRVRAFAPEFPVELDELVARMLAKPPGDRPTMKHIGATFAALRSHKPIGALSATAPANPTPPADTAPARTRSRSKPIVAVGALAVVAIAAGGYAITRRGQAPRAPADQPAVGASASPRPMSAPATSSPTAPPRASGSGACPSDMVAVPAGTFYMGTDTDSDDEDSRPQHEVTLSAFCIDHTETTVGAYAACVASGACTAAPTTVRVAPWSPEKTKLWSRFCNGDRADRKDHPVNCVDWEQARIFCAAAGKRLPTEAEWEFAARGTDGRRYPWGNDPPSATRLDACGIECRELSAQVAQAWQAMYEERDGWETTAPVGMYPAGASPFGALDMAGNVSEWVGDWSAPYRAAPQTNPTGEPTGASGGRVVRNNDWESFKARDARTTHRDHYDPTYRTSYVGFRCAR